MASYSVSFMSKHPHSPGGTLSHLKTATGHITPRAKQELYQKLYRKTKKMYFQSGSERVHWLSWPALLRASGTLTANTRFHLFSAELMKYRSQKKQKQKPPPKDVCYTLARIGQKRNSEETGSCESYSAGRNKGWQGVKEQPQTFGGAGLHGTKARRRERWRWGAGTLAK